MGTVSSFLLFVILVVYAYYKLSIMINKKAVDILSAVKQDFFEPEYTFGSKQGFNIAVAVFDPFDPSSYRQLDRSYGQVRFLKFSWGPNDKGEFETRMTQIQTHECSEEDFGIPGNNADSKFWPITQSQKIIHQAAKNLFVCVDPEEMVV